MKFYYFTIFIIPFFLFTNNINAQEIMIPKAKKVYKELTTHGHTRIDYYYWLNQREDKEVIKYLEEENAYTKKMLESTETLQEKLFNEMTARIKPDDNTVPYFKNGYYYYTRFEKGKEYPFYCRKKELLDAEEEIMLDVNKLAEGYSYFNVVGINVSPDNKMIAFAVDTLSRRIFEIKFKNLETGEILSETIKNTSGNSVWANDNKTIFYVTKDDALRPCKVWRYKLGEKNKNELVFNETDETFVVSISKTKSNKYILISSKQTLSTEYRFLDADNPSQNFKIFQQRERGLEYSIDHLGESFYVLTNLDALNFRLMKTTADKTSKENWVEYLPHRKNVLLNEFELFKNFIALEEINNGQSSVRIINLTSKEDFYINFDEEAYSAYIGYNPEYNSEQVRIIYSSLTTPVTVIDYNFITKEKEIKKVDFAGEDFNKELYESKRLFATANDGTLIPISLVYKKGIERNGNNPLLLYGYGSYGISTFPTFNSVRLSLLNRGFIYAIAHIRGGQEMGRQWYEDGKLLKKMNTFTDFIDAAKFLIKEKYTSSNHLYANGGSAGGLLMGAVVNLAPDLFNGVIAAVPFVDVVTTMLDETIPLTTEEYDEWGNPNDKVYYDYMLSYSPYDNVEAKNYPNLLVTTGLHDSQVQYWEPAKWVAKLRELKTDKNLLLLYTNMDAGHSGASGRFKRLNEYAINYAFLFLLEDIKE